MIAKMLVLEQFTTGRQLECECGRRFYSGFPDKNTIRNADGNKVAYCPSCHCQEQVFDIPAMYRKEDF